MIKKNILVISLLFFLNSCGFQPIYSKNNNANFSIEQVDFTGDRELNNFLKINLNRYKNEKADNKIFLEVLSKYNKVILTKDNSGGVSNYQLEAEVVFLIKSTTKRIVFTEIKIMESKSDKFEEDKFEKSTKQSFASTITNKLISELIIN